MITSAAENQQLATKQLESWFDDFMHHLRADRLMLETNTASDELKQMYHTLSQSHPLEIVKLSRAVNQAILVRGVILKFIELLGETLPSKLAFNYNNSEVLAWAEVNDNDEELTAKIIKAEGKTNAEFHNLGFDIDVTIVEKGDLVPVPNHYKAYN